MGNCMYFNIVRYVSYYLFKGHYGAKYRHINILLNVLFLNFVTLQR